MLQHALKHSNKKQSYKDALMASRGVVAEKPEGPKMLEDGFWLWNAFTALSAQRHYTSKGGPQPVSVADIKAYSDLVCLTKPEREFLLRVMGKLDYEYVSYQYKQMAEEAKKNQRKKGGGVGPRRGK